MVGAGAAVLLIIVLALGVRGCLNAREERAYEDYVREVTALATESDQQSGALFELLANPDGQSSVDIQNNVNGFRVEAEQLVDRAEAAEHPEALDRAQGFLVEVLEFRSAGMAGVAERLPTALGEQGRGAAVAQIAAQMQNFLASDVIYSQRVIPNLEGPLREEDLLNEVGEIPESRSLPDIAWLEPTVVRDRIAELRGGGDDAAATPGTHGTGLSGVTVQPSGQALVEGGATQVAGDGDLAFDVAVENQGENDESDIPVRIAITGGDQPIELDGELDSIAAGETGTVTVPLTEDPPTGQELEVSVTVEPVPGEEDSSNNEGTFAVTFTSG